MNKQPIEPKDFTPLEIQAFTAILGICAVCATACYLHNVFVLFGLLGVFLIVVQLESVK